MRKLHSSLFSSHFTFVSFITKESRARTQHHLMLSPRRQVKAVLKSGKFPKMKHLSVRLARAGTVSSLGFWTCMNMSTGIMNIYISKRNLGAHLDVHSRSTGGMECVSSLIYMGLATVELARHVLVSRKLGGGTIMRLRMWSVSFSYRMWISQTWAS